MRDTALESVLRRDRHAVLAALLVLALLAWAYVAWLSTHMVMPAASMPGMAFTITPYCSTNEFAVMG